MGAYKSVMFCSLCMQQGEINSWATDFWSFSTEIRHYNVITKWQTDC
jgi:hypothetical protein